jgi:hypothetical protein
MGKRLGRTPERSVIAALTSFLRRLLEAKASRRNLTLNRAVPTPGNRAMRGWQPTTSAKSFLTSTPELTGLLFLFFSILAQAQAQLLFLGGLDPVPSSGSYSGFMVDSTRGEAVVGARRFPITFGLSADPGEKWVSDFSFDVSSTGLSSGATLTFSEYLLWNGAGPTPFTDWVETLNSSGFAWQAGKSIVLATFGAGTISSGGQTLDLNLTPQAYPGELIVQGTAIYNGPALAAMPGATLNLEIIQQPAVPEIATTSLLCSMSLLVFALGVRLCQAALPKSHDQELKPPQGRR